MDSLHIISALCLTVALVMIFSQLLRRTKLPPGPTGLPFLGNTLQVPQQHAWKRYNKWAEDIGPLFSLNVAGSIIIVIANAQVAQDLLNKRSLVTSGRPRMIMANELVMKGMHLLLRQYDSSYILHQRMQSPVLSIRAASSYAKLLELKTLQLLYNLIKQSTEPDFTQLIAVCNLGIVYALVYGMEVETGNEPFLVTSRKTQAALGRVSTPGAYIVDTFPVLNYLPRFLAPWKREAEILYAEESSLHLQNLEFGLRSAGWNFAKQFSRSPEAEKMSRIELAYSLGITVNAGFDTTTMQLEWFIVACLNFPHCLVKAQAELDEVVGRNRLPMLADKDKLPYVNSMLKECLRWRTIMHGGFPHAATEEIEYQGYHIPKGTILLPQIWTIDQDDTVYDHPEDFDPDRWLAGKAPANGPIATWGFGRRICPGRHLAKNNLFLVVARLMWAFDIKPARDEKGDEINVDPDAIDGGFNTKPLPFRARFEVRTGMSEAIEKEWQGAEKDLVVILNDADERRRS